MLRGYLLLFTDLSSIGNCSILRKTLYLLPDALFAAPWWPLFQIQRESGDMKCFELRGLKTAANNVAEESSLYTSRLLRTL